MLEGDSGFAFSKLLVLPCGSPSFRLDAQKGYDLLLEALVEILEASLLRPTSFCQRPEKRQSHKSQSRAPPGFSGLGNSSPAVLSTRGPKQDHSPMLLLF